MTIAAGVRGHSPAVLIQPIPEESVVGYAPTVLVQPAPESLASKYARVWTFPAYRDDSPGEQLAHTFLQEAKPPRDAEIIDFGCGTGRGAFMLALFGGLRVTMLDFAENCLDEEVQQSLTTQKDRIKFRKADLTEGSPVTAPYGFCCDVMEHIPTDKVQQTLVNILAAAQHVFFSISTKPDRMGDQTIGEDLHLTVKPMDWWLAEFAKAGAVVHWSKVDQYENGFLVYCTAWKDADEVIKGGSLNTEIDIVNEQVRANILAGWKHAHPYDRQDREVIMLAGGPSMPEHLEKIKELREAGAALVTMNGAYNWALEQGLKPSMHIVVDAREFNSRFTRTVSPDCLYLMASQVHPKTLEGLPHERTFLWHSGVSLENEALIRKETGSFYPVPGGSTVALRSIPLLRMLGFWRMHIFGMDSCVWRKNADHHAYPQPENDDEAVFPVACGGQQFYCSPWHISQASEFRSLIKMLGDEVELEVYGDGLIAHIIQTGADLALLKELE